MPVWNRNAMSRTTSREAPYASLRDIRSIYAEFPFGNCEFKFYNVPQMRASKTPAVQLRPGRDEDVPKLCEFAEELLHKWDARTTARDAQRVYERVLQSPELGVILVAENEANICGFAYACHEWRSEYGGETMDLVELFVEHSWRNRGVGRTLLEGLIEHARSRGIRRFTSQVHPGNAAIERALETCGFDPERRTLWALHL